MGSLLLNCRAPAAINQDVAQFQPDELPAVLGEPQGLRHHLRIRPHLSPGRQIHLPHQCNWKRVPGSSDCHHELQNLQSVLPADKVSSLSNSFFSQLNAILLKRKSILLIENVIESVKFTVSMYLLTYVGAIMNGLTIITLTWVAMFSVPRVYRDNQKQIDDAP